MILGYVSDERYACRGHTAQLIAGCILAVVGCGIDKSPDGNYMEYEGQRFQTSKQYTDWDEFKDDPNNYLHSESERMSEAVRAVEFLKSAPDRQTVMEQMFEKQFPGFGCGQLGILNRDQLNECAAFSIEIPRTDLSRYAGYVRIDGRFVLVADFVGPEVPMIAMISVEDGFLNFHGMDKSIIRREPIPGRE